MSGRRIATALWGAGAFTTPRAVLWTIGTVCLEIIARLLGRYDVVRHRPQHVWAVSATTKDHIADGVTGDGQQNVLVFHLVDFQRRSWSSVPTRVAS